MATPLRNVRVDDALWARALEAAEANGETISDAVREFLERYARKHEREQRRKAQANGA